MRVESRSGGVALVGTEHTRGAVAAFGCNVAKVVGAYGGSYGDVHSIVIVVACLARVHALCCCVHRRRSALSDGRNCMRTSTGELWKGRANAQGVACAAKRRWTPTLTATGQSASGCVIVESNRRDRSSAGDLRDRVQSNKDRWIRREEQNNASLCAFHVHADRRAEW